MKVVQFVRGYQGYNAGESAGFTDERAKRLVDAGYAKFAAVPSQKVTKDTSDATFQGGNVAGSNGRSSGKRTKSY
jgi:hypothetical protein